MPASASSRNPISRTMFEPAHRVQLDGRVLLLGQLARLLQHLRGHAELADIVQHARVPDRLDALAPHADLARDHDRTTGYPVAVTAGVEVLGLDRLAQRAHRGLVRLLLLGELRHRPAGDEQRDQHQQRREEPDYAPQCGYEQAVGRVAEVGEQQPCAQPDACPRRHPVGWPGQPEHAAEQAVIGRDMDQRRAGERRDDRRKRVFVRQSDMTAEGDKSAAGQVRTERVHRRIENTLQHVRAAAQAQCGTSSHNGGAHRTDQDNRGKHGGRTRGPGYLPLAEVCRPRFRDNDQDSQEYDVSPAQSGEWPPGHQHSGDDHHRTDVDQCGPRELAQTSPSQSGVCTPRTWIGNVSPKPRRGRAARRARPRGARADQLCHHRLYA